jgi:ADP-ribose pyrophosphatase
MNDNSYYQFVSRKKEIKDLPLVKEKYQVDAVRILPYYIENDEVYYVLISEYRLPVNRYLYSLPAGLIESNEDPLLAAKRELKEETGYSFKEMILDCGTNFISPGMTDESISTYVCQVDPVKGKQHLDPNEKINVIVVKDSDLLKFIKDNDESFGFQSKLLLLYVYYMNLSTSILHKK